MRGLTDNLNILSNTVEELRKSVNMLKLIQAHDSTINTDQALRIAPTVCNGLVISIRIFQTPQDLGQKINLRQSIPTSTWKADYGPLRIPREP